MKSSKLSKLGLVGVFSSLMISMANAGSDVENQAKLVNWSGMYVGISSGAARQTFAPSKLEANQRPMTLYVLANSGFAGLNFTFGNSLVFSLEGDANYYSKLAENVSLRKLAASGRVRLGFGGKNIMPYLSGGVIWVDEMKLPPLAQKILGKEKLDTKRMGYTGGAGIDIAYASNIFARVEYRFNLVLVQLPNKAPTIDKAVIGSKSHEFRVGVGFKY